MADVRDYELLKSVQESPEGPRRSPLIWVASALLIVAIGAAAYVVFGGRSESPETTTAGRQDRTAQKPSDQRQPLGAEVDPIDLPPLSETDVVVRDLVKALSSHPSVTAWLTTDNLVRNFTVVVANVAEGRTPSRHLTVLRPSARFDVEERGEDLYIDPRSYDRYNPRAAAVASLDPQGAARLYATLKPRIEDAYRELGVPDTPFDQTLERAIIVLLQTPVLDDPVRLRPHGAGFAFAEPKLEGLTAAQKHLLRAGPRNVRVIQDSLRNIALALGIPEERLPPRS